MYISKIIEIKIYNDRELNKGVLMKLRKCDDFKLKRY